MIYVSFIEIFYINAITSPHCKPYIYANKCSYIKEVASSHCKSNKSTYSYSSYVITYLFPTSKKSLAPTANPTKAPTPTPPTSSPTYFLADKSVGGTCPSGSEDVPESDCLA